MSTPDTFAADTATRGGGGGCGGTGECQCARNASAGGGMPAADVPRVNGLPLLAPGERLQHPDELRERAHTELLRQEAVRQGRIADRPVHAAPQPTEAEREAIEAMVDEAVTVPEPTEEACRRYYDAHKPHFVTGQSVHVRHILFAVTPGIDVHALSRQAESALLQLTRKQVEPGQFEKLARQLSNCPTGATGGDLGWVGPQDCAPELANELFFQHDALWGMGVHPRLVHTRYGFHIIEVLGHRRGQLQSFETVRERIGLQLQLAARATGLRQYMAILVGQSVVTGIELEGAASPLVQ